MQRLPLVLQYHISSFLEYREVIPLEQCSRYWRDTILRPYIPQIHIDYIYHIVKYQPQKLYIIRQLYVDYDETTCTTSKDVSMLKLTSISYSYISMDEILDHIQCLPSTITDFDIYADYDFHKVWNALQQRNINLKSMGWIDLPTDISHTNLECIKVSSYTGPTKFPPSLHAIELEAYDCKWLDYFDLTNIDTLTIHLHDFGPINTTLFINQSHKLQHITNLRVAIDNLYDQVLPDFLLQAIVHAHVSLNDIDNIIKMPNLESLLINFDPYESRSVIIKCSKSMFAYWPKLLFLDIDPQGDLTSTLDIIMMISKNIGKANPDSNSEYDYLIEADDIYRSDIYQFLEEHFIENILLL